MFGAYGLRLTGVPGAERALVRASPDWPSLRLQVTVGTNDFHGEQLDASSAHLRLRTGGCIDIDRARGSVMFTVSSPLTAEQLVHPFLAPVAAVTAHWYGRESFHAGGVAIGDAVWAIVGDRGTGKSSTLAALAARAVDIVCDDVLVVDRLEPYAGPRTIDLRPDAAAALGLGENIGLAGARERWRLRLAPLDRRLKLAGWIFTAWSEETALRPLPASVTLTRLLQSRGLTVPPNDPAAYLRLSKLPAWEFRRPREWEALPAAVDLLLDAVTA